MKTLLSLTAIILLVLGCNTSKKKIHQDMQEPINHQRVQWDERLHDIWILKALDGKRLSKDSPTTRLELFPSENRLAGNGGCNELFGSCTAKDNTISFSRIGATKKFCPDSQKLENSFISTLQEVDSYVIKDLQLILLQGKKERMILQKTD